MATDGKGFTSRGSPAEARPKAVLRVEAVVGIEGQSFGGEAGAEPVAAVADAIEPATAKVLELLRGDY